MKGTMCKIRVTKEITSIFDEYRPNVGEIYDAEYSIPGRFKTEFCVVDILDKRIVLERANLRL